MGFFADSFDSAQVGKAKKIFRDAEVRHLPISKIGEAVVRAVIGCDEALRPLLMATDEKDRMCRKTEVSHEVTYFFLHMVSRTAYAMLGPVKGKTLCNKTGELIPLWFVESLFGHWPKKLKDKISSEFYVNLNSAEQEYAECRAIFLPEEPFSETALFSRFARNVAGPLGREGDKQAMMNVVKASMELYTQMGLEELVLSARDVL